MLRRKPPVFANAPMTRLAARYPLRTDLLVDALEMANGLRRPMPGLNAHTDRGSQYTSNRYTGRLDELGAAPSVGSRDDAYDNAMAEVCVATVKSELIDARRFPSYEHVEHEILHWIASWIASTLAW
jgi:putative transposase